MRLARVTLIWALLAAAVFVPIAAAAASPLLEWRGPVYILAGFAGIVALGLMLVQPLLIGGYLPGLSAYRGRRVHHWIGRALVLNPRLLLLDEPLEGLAPLIVEELLPVLTTLVRQEGLSAIFVEQNPARILAITDHAVVLERGTIVHAGDSRALLADTATLDRHLAVG